MVLIFAGLVQLGLIYERQIGVENAVRDGARRPATYTTTSAAEASTNGAFVWGLVFGASGSMLTNVQGYDGLQATGMQVCYRTALDAANLNSVIVNVSVTYHHPLFLPL